MGDTVTDGIFRKLSVNHFLEKMKNLPYLSFCTNSAFPKNRLVETTTRKHDKYEEGRDEENVV